MAYIGSTPTSQNFTSGTDYFSGTGSQTAYTLTRTVNSVNDIEVVINNVVQQPSTSYTLSGTTITFTSAPSSGTNNIYVRYLATNMQSFTVPANSIDRNKLSTDLQNALAGPAFRAYATGGTSCTSGAFTKLLFAGVTLDTNSNYASSRFTPTVAGYYQINAKVEFLSTSTTGFFRLSVYKNGGTSYFDGTPDPSRSYLSTWSPAPSVSGLVYCNGTTDCIEIYAYQNSGSTFNNDTGTATTYCSGFLARSA